VSPPAKPGACLRELPGCAGVVSIPTTAGVLVAYHGDLRTVVGYTKDHSLFRVGHRPPQMPLGRHLALVFGPLNKQLLSATGGTLDLSSAVFLALFGSGVADLVRGHSAGAMTLLAHAGGRVARGTTDRAAATEAKALAVLFEGA
jgi:hypothetical protein